MARIKKIARKYARQKYTSLQYQFNMFFYSVCQSIATLMFVYFVRAHVCLSVTVDVAFYFRLDFGSDVGSSLYLDFGGRGFESGFCFLGVGSVFFIIGFCLGLGVGFTFMS